MAAGSARLLRGARGRLVMTGPYSAGRSINPTRCQPWNAIGQASRCTQRALRLALVAVGIMLCGGCFGPFRVTGGSETGEQYRWPGEFEAARVIALRSADDQANGSDSVAIAAALSVRQAANQLERASIIWRDETLPNRYGNGADLQRNDRDRRSWMERKREELEREAAQRIASLRGQP